MAVGVSTFLIAAAVIIDILVFTPSLLVTTTLVDTTSVQDLTQLQLGIWTACFSAQDENGTNKIVCLSPIFGYTLTVSHPHTPAVTVAKSSSTAGLFVEAVAGAVALIAVFTRNYKIHYLVLAVAIGVHLISGILDFVLFHAVSKTMPLFEGQTKAILGPGFYLTVVSFIILLLAAFSLYIEES